MKTPKINKAFNKLNRFGIVAKKNFTCCNTCGHYEINDFLQHKRQSYIFYHMQSNDNLKKSGSCHLGHSIRKKDKQKVYDILKEYDLKPDWDFTDNKTIFITENILNDWNNNNCRSYNANSVFN